MIFQGGMNMDREVYMVLCDFGPSLGRAFLEADLSVCDRIGYAVEAVEHHPEGVVSVHAWNPFEGSSRDVSEEVALAWWEKHQDGFDIRCDILPRLVADHLESFREVA